MSPNDLTGVFIFIVISCMAIGFLVAKVLF
jgi:hypothetical protein